MATPISFNAVYDWVDHTDPTNIPPAVRVLTASDLIRYETGIKQTVDRVNEHDSLIATLNTALTTLTNRTTGTETTNAAQATTLANLQGSFNTLQAQYNTMDRPTVVRTLATAYTVNSGNRIHVHTVGAASWTLPAPSGSAIGRDVIIHNRGTGVLTLWSATGSQIFRNGAAAANIAIAISETHHLVCDGTYWVVLTSDSNATI